MNLRRTTVLLTALAAAFTVTGPAMAAPAESDQGARRVLDLPGATATSRMAPVDGSKFTGMSPVRVLDTRSGLGVPAPAPVPAGGTITVDLSTRVPAGTTAVVLNLTGVAPTAATFVTAWPAEEARPTVSNVNLAARETRANAVTVALGPSRRLNLYNSAGRINVLADLAGYYSPTGDAWYNGHTPHRVLDTRNGAGPVRAGGTITVDTGSLLPSTGAKVVTLNVTAVYPTTTTYLTAFPAGAARPNASSVNAAAGTVTANQVTVLLGSGKDIQIYNSVGNAHVLVDIVGYYDTGFGSAFYPVSPVRVLDTRSDGGGPMQGGYYYPIVVAEDPASPEAQISAMVLNVTGTGGTAATYLTLFPSGSPVPSVSTVNLAARQTAANLATTELGWDADEIGPYYGFNVYNSAGSIHVLLDWAGYFIPAA